MTTTIGGSYPAVNSDSDATINGLTVGKGTNGVAGNTAVGSSALAGSNSGGGENTAIGLEALNANTTGADQVGVGYRALAANTTGTENVSIGAASLRNSTTGNYNVAVGRSALNQNTTASNNTAVGYQSLYSNTTGQYNTAVGVVALYSNTTASYNTAIGWRAGYSNTTGTGYNTFVGYQAGYSLTTGESNTVVGGYAGVGLTTGSNNTFVGSGTGGYGAGWQVTTGSKNTILGAYSGNNGGLDIRTASNNIVLSDGDGNPRGYFDANGNLNMQGSTQAGTGQAGAIATKVIGTTNGYCTNIISAASYGASGGGIPTIFGNWNSANGWGIGPHSSSNDSTIRLGIANTSASGVSWAGYANVQGGTYTNSSDYRIKKNVETLTTEVLPLIKNLRPVSYNIIQKDDDGKDADTRKEIGFIAHELQQYFPEFVTGEKDAIEGEQVIAQGVDYAKFTSILVKAIQELKAEFDAYKATHP